MQTLQIVTPIGYGHARVPNATTEVVDANTDTFSIESLSTEVNYAFKAQMSTFSWRSLYSQENKQRSLCRTATRNTAVRCPISRKVITRAHSSTKRIRPATLSKCTPRFLIALSAWHPIEACQRCDGFALRFGNECLSDAPMRSHIVPHVH